MELTRLGRVLPNIRYMLDDLDGGLVDRIRAMVQEGLKLRVFNNVMSNSLISWIVQQFLHYLSECWLSTNPLSEVNKKCGTKSHLPPLLKRIKWQILQKLSV